jgi:hypothetical protein
MANIQPKAGKSKGGKPPAKSDNPEQSKRFIETARELGADETAEGFDKAFGGLNVRAPKKLEPEKNKPPKKSA